LEVEAQAVGLAPGAKVNGLAFTQFDGAVYWDKAGLLTRGGAPTTFASLAEWEAVARGDAKLPKAIQDILKTAGDQRSDAQKAELRRYFAEHAYSRTRALFAGLHQERDRLAKAEAELDNSLPATMVMEEMTKPRDTFMLVRGDWQTKGEKVTA